MAKFLSWLSHGYKHLKSQLMTSNDHPSSKNIYAPLQHVAIASTQPFGERSAFVSSRGDVGGHDDSRQRCGGRSGQGRGCETNNMKCTKYGCKTHILNHCWGC